MKMKHTRKINIVCKDTKLVDDIIRKFCEGVVDSVIALEVYEDINRVSWKEEYEEKEV